MKFFYLSPALLLFTLLIALLDDVSQAATATLSDHPQDVESRQLNGFSGNAAAYNFGGSNVIGSTPTALPSKASFSTNSFNNFNAISSSSNKKKEINKTTEKGYNEKDSSTRILDRFNHRYPDGSYEYRYELDDGTARYERGYFLLYDNRKTLVVVGYYAYRLADGRYLTVFYNADQNGYRQNQSITSQGFPNLPRSIEVPQYKSSEAEGEDYTRMITTTLSPRVPTKTTKRGSF